MAKQHFWTFTWTFAAEHPWKQVLKPSIRVESRKVWGTNMINLEAQYFEVEQMLLHMLDCIDYIDKSL